MIGATLGGHVLDDVAARDDVELAVGERAVVRGSTITSAGGSMLAVSSVAPGMKRASWWPRPPTSSTRRRRPDALRDEQQPVPHVGLPGCTSEAAGEQRRRSTVGDAGGSRRSRHRCGAHRGRDRHGPAPEHHHRVPVRDLANGGDLRHPSHPVGPVARREPDDLDVVAGVEPREHLADVEPEQTRTEVVLRAACRSGARTGRRPARRRGSATARSRGRPTVSTSCRTSGRRARCRVRAPAPSRESTGCHCGDVLEHVRAARRCASNPCGAGARARRSGPRPRAAVVQPELRRRCSRRRCSARRRRATLRTCSPDRHRCRSPVRPSGPGTARSAAPRRPRGSGRRCRGRRLRLRKSFTRCTDRATPALGPAARQSCGTLLGAVRLSPRRSAAMRRAVRPTRRSRSRAGARCRRRAVDAPRPVRAISASAASTNSSTHRSHENCAARVRPRSRRAVRGGALVARERDPLFGERRVVSRRAHRSRRSAPRRARRARCTRATGVRTSAASRITRPQPS